MPAGHAEARNIVFPQLAPAIRHSLMKTFSDRADGMSSTIGPELVSQRCVAPEIIAEWQQHGPATLSGYASRKLRLAFAPMQSVMTARAAG